MYDKEIERKCYILIHLCLSILYAYPFRQFSFVITALYRATMIVSVLESASILSSTLPRSSEPDASSHPEQPISARHRQTGIANLFETIS